ncbi:hypothetical protein [Simkania sp.]|uniref:hypothetical protein n=1 Tax=Simkania sp. TaxID=34094 RepID=UPI003B51C98C
MSTLPLSQTLPSTLPNTLPVPDFSGTYLSSTIQAPSTLSPEKPDRHVDVWTSFTSKFPDLPPLVAQGILNGVYQAQAELSKKQTVEILPTEMFPYKIFVDPTGFQVCPNTTSSGGSGTVWIGDYFSTARITIGTVQHTPTKQQLTARKVSVERSLTQKNKFSPAAKAVRKYIEQATPTKKELFAATDSTSKGTRV